MIEIKQMLVPDSKKPKYVVKGKEVIIPMTPEYITIHETDNTSPTADDLAHARLQQNGNSRNASWHLQVDEDSCIQSIPFNECALHAGDNMGTGNMKSIALEICVNSDGNFKNAVKNAVDITKYLMNKFNIPISKVVQHNYWSGKNCPRYLRSGEKGISWNDFISLLKEVPVSSQLTPQSTQTKSQSAQPKKKYVVLPATEDSWRVYPLNKSPKKGNECGSLNPKKFHGLEYEVLGNPQTDVYIIQTQNFGKVQIYAASSTGARIV